MKNVRFDKSSGTKYFRFVNSDGVEDKIEYKPSIINLWDSLRKEDFSVELLINPLLNRARNVYDIFDKDDSKDRVGMIFPVSALDSDDSFEQVGSNYAFVAFQTLLERLPNLNNSEREFSDNFEENVCVCVFNLRTIKKANPLHLCINSLRKFGYSFFEPKNEIKPVEGYKPELYVEKKQKNIGVCFEEPKLYSNPIINMMLRALPHAHNVIHRFVLLYQVIETMMEIVSRDKINEEILKYQNHNITSNDFQEKMRDMGREKERLKEIFNRCNLTTNEFSCFQDSCKRLYALTKYVPDNESDKSMYFYSFRNQMTHSFRNLHHYPEEVAETIQGFEKVVLTILEKYK